MHVKLPALAAGGRLAAHATGVGSAEAVLVAGCKMLLARPQLLPATLLQLLLLQAKTSLYTCAAAGSVHMACSVAAAIPPYPRKTVPFGTPQQDASFDAGHVTVNATQ